MFCPRCEAEYRPGFTRCSDCGVDLVDSLEQKPARRRPSADDAPIVLRCFTTTFEAGIAQALLQAAGIDSVVRSDDAGGTNPSVAFSRGAELLIRAKDATQAREVLASDDACSR
ncbi:MAG: DUF2007 domain-containing protein [Actinobacteria bacterium]|nr:DUF2007 domain-containing protein [Actinomycetota bacterium]